MDICNDSEVTMISSDDEPSDSEIEDILKKYTNPTTSHLNYINNPNENDEYFNQEVCSPSEPVKNNKCQSNSAFISLDVDDEKQNDKVIDFELENKTRGKRKLQEAAKIKNQQKIESKRKKAEKLREAEMRKVAKNIEKERKREMMEEQKMIKNALKTVGKSTRPDECMKYIIVELDQDMSENEYGVVLKKTFQERQICFRTKSQVLPNLISWSRKIQTIDNMLLKESEVTEDRILLIMRATEFTEYVQNNTLIVYIENIFSLVKFKQFTMVIVGMEKTQPLQEIAITEVQMLTKTYFRFAKDAEGLADLLVEVTKAVAQIPYKLQKEEKYKHHNEYFNDSNKDTVKIDKNGNGLSRLWHQMLTMFPLARLETAEAITAAYPTPSSLFQAYETCEGCKEDLLQDLCVRRAHGPLSSGRKIGPELSRKCFNFFCATENKLL